MAPSAPPLRLWGRTSSINVRKVVWCAQELGLAVQRTDAGGHFGLVQEDDYLRRNPNGLVPLLQDGDLVLWESNVVVRYLCARYAPDTLYPQDLAERFTGRQAFDAIYGHILDEARLVVAYSLNPALALTLQK